MLSGSFPQVEHTILMNNTICAEINIHYRFRRNGMHDCRQQPHIERHDDS